MPKKFIFILFSYGDQLGFTSPKYDELMDEFENASWLGPFFNNFGRTNALLDIMVIAKYHHAIRGACLMPIPLD